MESVVITIKTTNQDIMAEREREAKMNRMRGDILPRGMRSGVVALKVRAWPRKYYGPFVTSTDSPPADSTTAGGKCLNNSAYVLNMYKTLGHHSPNAHIPSIR